MYRASKQQLDKENPAVKSMFHSRSNSVSLDVKFDGCANRAQPMLVEVFIYAYISTLSSSNEPIVNDFDFYKL